MIIGMDSVIKARETLRDDGKESGFSRLKLLWIVPSINRSQFKFFNIWSFVKSIQFSCFWEKVNFTMLSSSYENKMVKYPCIQGWSSSKCRVNTNDGLETRQHENFRHKINFHPTICKRRLLQYPLGYLQEWCYVLGINGINIILSVTRHNKLRFLKYWENIFVTETYSAEKIQSRIIRVKWRNE